MKLSETSTSDIKILVSSQNFEDMYLTTGDEHIATSGMNYFFFFGNIILRDLIGEALVAAGGSA